MQKPPGRQPSPATLITFWVSISQPPNEFTQQRLKKHELARACPELTLEIERELILAREIMEAKETEVMAVSWVGKGVRTGTVRNGQVEHGVVPANSMNLLHDRYDIIEVFDDVVSKNFVKMPGRQRPGYLVEIENYVWTRRGHKINVDRVLELLPPRS